MKIQLKTLPAFAVLSVALSVVQAADTSGPTPDDLPPLYVEIIVYEVGRLDNERFSFMAASITESFKKLELSREIMVVRFPSRIPEDSPHIQITIPRWEFEDTVYSADYQCLVSARILLPNGEKIDFETIRGIGNDDPSDRYNRGFELSWYDAMDKLQRRIAERFSPDALGAAPPKVDG